MKTLRRIMVIGLLIGAYHSGIAQSNEQPEFKSEQEKQAWIDAHEVRSETDFSSDLEKEAWIQANPEKYAELKSATIGEVSIQHSQVGSDSTVKLSSNPKKVNLQEAKSGSAPAMKVRVNNTVNALPADYKPSVQETKTSDQ